MTVYSYGNEVINCVLRRVVRDDVLGAPDCVIRRKTDTGSGAKRTAFRGYPDKVPAESGHL